MIGGRAVEPLRSAAFRRYLAGQLPSISCSWAQVVALTWVVVQLDPWALGWVAAAQFLPSLVLGPWFGALVDRHDRRRLLVLAELGLGLVAVAYLLAADSLPLLLGLAVLWGVINALDTPARRALVPMLVPPAHAASAAALTNAVMLIGMTVGSALGGVLIATAGTTVAFAVNAVSFAADAVLLCTLRVGPSPRVPRAPGQVRDGIRHVWTTPALRGPMLAVAVIGTLAFTFPVSAPLLIRETFDGGAELIGTAFTAVTAGSLAGALFAAVRGAPAAGTLGWSAAAMAAALGFTAAAPNAPLALVGLVGLGVTWSVFVSAVVAVLQTADPRLMGRVMAVFSMVLLGGTALGAPIVSALADAAGARAPFVLGALAALVAALLTRLPAEASAGATVLIDTNPTGK